MPLVALMTLMAFGLFRVLFAVLAVFVIAFLACFGHWALAIFT